MSYIGQRHFKARKAFMVRTQRKFWFLLALCTKHCLKHRSISFDLLNQWIHTHFHHIYLYGTRKLMVPDSFHWRPKFSNTCLFSGSLRRKHCVHVAFLGTSLPLLSFLGCNNQFSFLPQDIFLLKQKLFNAFHGICFILEQWLSTGVILCPGDIW